jgi:hypothetical protein
LQALGVGPVDVVEDKDQTAGMGGGGHDLENGVEENVEVGAVTISHRGSVD